MRPLPAVKPRSWLFDLFGDYVELRDRELATATIVSLAADFQLGERAIRSALLRLQRDGWLKTRRTGIYSACSLTERGGELIEEGRRRILQGPEHSWDGRWLLVAYSIPEAQREARDKFRRELGWLGFAGLTNGLFISARDQAHQVVRLSRRLGLDDNVTLFRAEYDWPGGSRALVDRGWEVQELNREYQQFLASFAHFVDASGLTDQARFVIRFRLINAYRRFPFRDPGLPADLLPPDWRGFAAAELFRRLHDELAAGAMRYFDQRTAAAAA
ncbi:MAG: hypothetical protein KGJ86_05840 [Chloroflexota bacterium]|nr:hypothetical protein [Chloroflexota bacterium]